MLGEDRLDGGLISFRGCRTKREGDFGEPQLEQPVAASRLAIIVALGRGPAEDLDLAVVQAEASIDRGDLGLDRAFVRQQQARLAAFDDGRRDGAAVDVGKRLRGEDDGRVLLAQRLQPFAQLRREAVIVEREPAFVDDQERWPSIQTVADPMEEIRKDGRRRAAADQPFGFKGLDRSFP